jgi:NADH dehydrogenase
MEDHLRSIGLSYCILRPTVLFGKGDILINNIAWSLRYLPIFGIFGDGRYRLQPIYVDDLAEAAVLKAQELTNATIDAIGPETFRYRDMIEMIAAEIGVRPRIISLPPGLAYQMTRVIGWFVDDVVITREEIRGLMEERLYVKSSPLGTTKLSDWVHANHQRLGLNYTSEMARRLDRISQYRSN